MNVLKASNYNKYVDNVDILVKFIEVKNPCRIVIYTDYIKGLFNRNIKPDSLSDIHFNLINHSEDVISITGANSISISKTVDTYFSSILDNIERQLFNDESSFRKIVLDLSKPLRLEELKVLIEEFHVDVAHYSYPFAQEYDMNF